MPLTLGAHSASPATYPRHGDTPTDALRRAIHSLLGAAEPAGMVDTLFDVPVVARRCLGRHRPDRSAEERADLSRPLGQLLASTLRGVLASASGIRYLGWSASGPLVTVRAELAADGRPPAALELRVHRVQGRWLVNDFAVDRVSFVAQHRARLESRFGAPAPAAISLG